MKDQNADAPPLRSYLLGLVEDEHARTEIDERLMTDDDLAEQLTLAESDLIEEYLDGGLTPDEQKRFAQYFLADPERRQELTLIRNIREIAKRRTSEGPVRKSGFAERLRHAWPSLRLAAVSVLILAVAGIGVWQFRTYNSDTDKGLAALREAYSGRRPVESRLTAMPEYAPYSETRGAETGGPDAAALKRADRYLTDASTTGADAAARHAYGQYFLAAGDLVNAKRELELAGSLDASDARIKSDLGALHLEMAKQLGRDEDDAEALELLNRSVKFFDAAIALDPRLPEPYFGRALVLESVPNTEQAKAAWRRYLEIDSTSKWADEARRHLAELEQTTERERSAAELETDLLAAFQAGDAETARRLSGANRELVREKYMPQRLALSYTAAGPDRRPELLNALQFVGRVEQDLTGDRFAADLAKYYSSVPDQKLETLRSAHSVYREGLSLCLAEKYTEAAPAFEQARRRFSEAGNQWEANIAAYFVGYSLVNSGNVENGISELAAVERYAKDNQYPWLQATALHWVAGGNAKAKRHSQAVKAYEQALTLAERTGDRYQLQRNLLELAGRTSYVGQRQQSLGYLRKALEESARPNTSFRQRFRTLTNAFPILYGAGLPDLAVPATLEAASLAEKLGDKAFQSQAKAFAAQALVQKHDLEHARPLLEEACAIAATIPSDEARARQTAFCRLKSGNLARAAGEMNAAEEHYAEAARYYETANMPLNREEAQTGLLHSYLALHKTAELEAQLPVNIRFAEEYRREIQEESERASFLGTRSNIYDIAAAFEFDRGDHARAFEFSEMSAARALLDRIGKGVSARVGPGGSKLESLSEAAPASLAAVRERMPDNAQIVQYSVQDGRILIWVVSGKNFAAREVSIPSWELDDKVSGFRKSILDREDIDGTNFRRLGRELYDLTVLPVLPLIDPSREVIIVPSRSLYNLPFAALVSPAGVPLLKDLRISYAPSASVFLKTTERAKERARFRDESVLAVGNPRFARDRFSGKADLPNAAAEAEAVALQYPSARTLLGPKATKAEFLNELPSAEVAHFAGHYVVVPGAPSLSYLLMAGGNAGDDDDKLTNLELSRTTLPATKLVVLAACRTGVEEFAAADGMIGLARTMLALDVPVVIGSQWDVDSASTEKLMTRFHQLRRSGGDTSAAALRQAQLEMLNDRSKPYGAPYYWAAFAAYGGLAEY